MRQVESSGYNIQRDTPIPMTFLLGTSFRSLLHFLIFTRVQEHLVDMPWRHTAMPFTPIIRHRVSEDCPCMVISRRHDWAPEVVESYVRLCQLRFELRLQG